MRVGAGYLIPPPARVSSLVKTDYNTGDIVKEVLDTYSVSKQQLASFAATLRGKNDVETCKKIFDFIKQNIAYKVDPGNVQLVKTPARLWQDREGDCKSFSIFAASCLYNLGIPGMFRFVSFSSQQIPTHVYVVAIVGGSEIIIDAVIDAFNTQKQYTYKIDYNMNSLYRLSGLPVIAAAQKPLTVVDPEYKPGKPVYNPRPGEFMLPVKADGSTTDALIEAAILKQRLEIEAAITARVSGIGAAGSVSNTAMQAAAELDARIKAAISGTDDDFISGGFFKKIFKGIKKVVLAPIKLVTKVVMAPFALILNKQLPPAAMGFAYIFIPDNVCQKLGDKICQKRKKQINLMRAICTIVQMKESHFKGLIENGIMKKTGKKPLVFLSEQFKQTIAGIGKTGKSFSNIPKPRYCDAIQGVDIEKDPGLADKTGDKLISSGNIWAMAGGAIIKLITAIVKLFKKKHKDMPTTAEDLAAIGPDPADWETITNDGFVAVAKEASPQGGSKLVQVLQAAGAAATAVTNAAQVFTGSQTDMPAVNSESTSPYSYYPQTAYPTDQQQQQQQFVPADNYNNANNNNGSNNSNNGTGIPTNMLMMGGLALLGVVLLTKKN